MGCDIHLLIEEQQDDGSWEFYAGENAMPQRQSNHSSNYHWALAGSRNYLRFGKLSDVRGPGPDANGFPDDCCPEANDWEKDMDLHSHTHYSVQEAARIFYETEYEREKLPGKAQLVPEHYYFGITPEQLLNTNYRLLIAYDN